MPAVLVALALVALTGCGGSRGERTAAPDRPAAPAASARPVVPGPRVVAGPTVVFATRDDGTTEYLAAVRLDRPLPGRRGVVWIDGHASASAFTASRRRHCYTHAVSDWEGGPALRRPRDGMVVTVAVGRTRPTEVYARRRVTARRVTVSQIANGPKQQVRLGRLGCGRRART